MSILGDAMSYLRGSDTKDSKKDKKALGEAEQAYNEGVSSLTDVLAPASFKLTARHLEIDGKFAATVFITTYPRYLDTTGFLQL